MGSRRGRGEGSIYRRKDGLWAAELTIGWSEDGKRDYKTVYGHTKKEVQDKLLVLLQKYSAGVLQAEDMTVRGGLELWLTSMKSQVQPTTWDRYEEQVRNHLRPYLGHYRVSKLQPLDIAGWLGKLEDRGVPVAARIKAAKVLRQFLGRCVQFRFVSRNEALSVPLPKRPEYIPSVWTRDHLRQFLTANRGQRLYPLYLLALDTGLRQGELLALEWIDLDLQARTVLVVKSLMCGKKGRLEVKAPKTRAGRRTVGFTPQTAVVLQARREALGPEARLVFPSTAGTYLNRHNVWDDWVEAVKRAGVPHIRFHDLRHLSSTYLLAGGENPKVVQERLGHSRIQMTLDTYSHILPELQARATEKMSTFLDTVLPAENPPDSVQEL